MSVSRGLSLNRPVLKVPQSIRQLFFFFLIAFILHCSFTFGMLLNMCTFSHCMFVFVCVCVSVCVCVCAHAHVFVCFGHVFLCVFVSGWMGRYV